VVRVERWWGFARGVAGRRVCVACATMCVCAHGVCVCVWSSMVCALVTDDACVVRSRHVLGRAATKARVSVVTKAANADMKFDDDWKKSSVAVHLASLFGWVIPSASPCPAFEDNASLFAVFSERISANLANFPQGPAADDKIWLYMLTWHMGLFACMMFGQIGVQARKQGYFK